MGLTPPLCSGYKFGLANRAARACPLGTSLTNPGSRLHRYQKRRKAYWPSFFFGAGGGTRTHTVSPPTDFESVTSTIPSHRLTLYIISHLFLNFKRLFASRFKYFIFPFPSPLYLIFFIARRLTTPFRHYSTKNASKFNHFAVKLFIVR